MQRKRHIAIRILKNNQGMTLVELLVSFALLLMLMTATVSTIMPAVKTFNYVMAADRAQSVSNLIVDKISGELETSRGNITVNGQSIEYADQKGNVVKLFARDGKLILDYNSGESEWFFTDNVYMGCKIAPADEGGLEFSKILAPDDSDKKNLVKIKLKVTARNGGYEYERSVIVNCYQSKTSIN